MKTFSVAVSVALLLSLICLQESSAVPLTQAQELEEPVISDNPVAGMEEAAMESWKMPYHNRHRRGVKCKFCCGCCTPGVCGVCCRF